MNFSNPKTKAVLDLYKPIWALKHMYALSGWDMETLMPENGVGARAMAQAKVSSIVQNLYLDKEFRRAVSSLAEESNLQDHEKAIVRILTKEISEYTKFSKEFIEDFEKTASEGRAAWKKAKEQNDFAIFSPYLEKLVDLSRRKAEYLGYDDHPYDALVDSFEEGLTTADLVTYFESIKPFIIEKIEKLDSSKLNLIKKLKYDKKIAKKINQRVLELLLADFGSLRLDTSSHPFTESIYSKSDVRITTRYEGENIAATIRSTIHEFGHALYEMQTHDALEFTPLRPMSLGLHESQSRFWENVVGNQPNFVARYFDLINKLGQDFEHIKIEDYLEYLNFIEPGFIRVDADQITYHMHILTRFEIEKDLIAGNLNVKDVRESWNEKYEKYLGIKPQNDSEGVLQDIHWSMGAFGYFSTYSIGSVLSAIWQSEIEKQIGLISELVKSDEGIKRIQDWLKENIHQFGSVYTFKELVHKVTGNEFTPDEWIRQQS